MCLSGKLLQAEERLLSWHTPDRSWQTWHKAQYRDVSAGWRGHHVMVHLSPTYTPGDLWSWSWSFAFLLLINKLMDVFYEERSQAWSRRRAHGMILILMENLADDLNRFFDRFDSPTFIPVCTTHFLAWCVFPSPNHSIYNMLQRAHAHLDT